MSFTGRRWFPQRRPHPPTRTIPVPPAVPQPRRGDGQRTQRRPEHTELPPLGGDDQRPSPHLRYVPTLLRGPR